MPEEKTPLEEPKQPQGWKDVQINENMPLSIIVNFLNVLNQRLCTVEDIVTTMYNGKAISLTDLYAIQAKEEQERLSKAQAEATPEKGE